MRSASPVPRGPEARARPDGARRTAPNGSRPWRKPSAPSARGRWLSSWTTRIGRTRRLRHGGRALHARARELHDARSPRPALRLDGGGAPRSARPRTDGAAQHGPLRDALHGVGRPPPGNDSIVGARPRRHDPRARSAAHAPRGARPSGTRLPAPGRRRRGPAAPGSHRGGSRSRAARGDEARGASSARSSRRTDGWRAGPSWSASRSGTMPLLTIRDLIRYRYLRERLVERLAASKLPTRFGSFRIVVYESRVDGYHHVALVKGTPGGPPGAHPRPLAVPHGRRLRLDALRLRRAARGRARPDRPRGVRRVPLHAPGGRGSASPTS